MRTPPPASDRDYNNADSYALAFDEAWKRHSLIPAENGLETQAKRDLILAELVDHPFALESPDRAREVADFRIRLLGL
jgi:hypothetical protein